MSVAGPVASTWQRWWRPVSVVVTVLLSAGAAVTESLHIGVRLAVRDEFGASPAVTVVTAVLVSVPALALRRQPVVAAALSWLPFLVGKALGTPNMVADFVPMIAVYVVVVRVPPRRAAAVLALLAVAAFGTQAAAPRLWGSAASALITVLVIVGLPAGVGLLVLRARRTAAPPPAAAPAVDGDSAEHSRVPEQRHPGMLRLTGRERQVLSLLAAGRSNAEIADLMNVSQETVKKHVSNLLGKLGVQNRTQAAVLAERHGFVTER